MSDDPSTPRPSRPARGGAPAYADDDFSVSILNLTSNNLSLYTGGQNPNGYDYTGEPLFGPNPVSALAQGSAGTAVPAFGVRGYDNLPVGAHGWLQYFVDDTTILNFLFCSCPGGRGPDYFYACLQPAGTFTDATTYAVSVSGFDGFAADSDGEYPTSYAPLVTIAPIAQMPYVPMQPSMPCSSLNVYSLNITIDNQTDFPFTLANVTSPLSTEPQPQMAYLIPANTSALALTAVTIGAETPTMSFAYNVGGGAQITVSLPFVQAGVTPVPTPALGTNGATTSNLYSFDPPVPQPVVEWDAINGNTTVTLTITVVRS